MISQFKSQNLSNTAWAFSKLAVCNEPLLASIVSGSGSGASQSQPQDLATIVWLLVTVVSFKLAAIGLLAVSVCMRLAEFIP